MTNELDDENCSNCNYYAQSSGKCLCGEVRPSDPPPIFASTKTGCIHWKKITDPLLQQPGVSIHDIIELASDPMDILNLTRILRKDTTPHQHHEDPEDVYDLWELLDTKISELLRTQGKLPVVKQPVTVCPFTGFGPCAKESCGFTICPTAGANTTSRDQK